MKTMKLPQARPEAATPAGRRQVSTTGHAHRTAAPRQNSRRRSTAVDNSKLAAHRAVELRGRIDNLLPPHVLDALKTHCEQNNRGPSETLQVALQEFLRAQEQAPNRPLAMPTADQSEATALFPCSTYSGDMLLGQKVDDARDEQFEDAMTTFEGLLSLVDGNPNYQQEREAFLLLVAGYQRLQSCPAYCSFLRHNEWSRMTVTEQEAECARLGEDRAIPPLFTVPDIDEAALATVMMRPTEKQEAA